MMHMRMPRSIMKRLSHGMTSILSGKNSNPNNKCLFSIQGFGYSLENLNQDGPDHS